jgi:hypothetical protein
MIFKLISGLKRDLKNYLVSSQLKNDLTDEII